MYILPDAFSEAKNLAHSNKLPDSKQVANLLSSIIAFLFPDYENTEKEQDISNEFQQICERLATLLPLCPECPNTVSAVQAFADALPNIKTALSADVKAMLLGDPAAESEIEVIKCYPGFVAISAYRIAHQLHQQKIKLLPRMMTEWAHGKTGIDIHPAAQIGNSFCIDHGTGIVIGETAQIGNSVKIYQGVTLGALSVDKSMASTKRHPSIEDEVVIYSGATILGGETVIGRNSIIGGNVWLVKSVEPNSTVYNNHSVSIKSN